MDNKLMADLDQWVAAHRGEFIEDLKTWCRVPSVTVPEGADGYRFGPACKKMLDTCLSMAERHGFATKNYDDCCGAAIYGDNPDGDYIGIFGHMDVVPAGAGWTKCEDPFEPVLEDDKYLFGRGTTDNKGPAMTGYYAMRYLLEKNIPLKNNVLFYFGMCEERGMHDIPEFLAREKAPKFGLVPDSRYPIELREGGIAQMQLLSPRMQGNVVFIKSGAAPNAPSATASAVLRGFSLAEVQQKLAGLPKLSARAVPEGVEIVAARDERGEGTVTANQRLTAAIADAGLAAPGDEQKAFDFLKMACADVRAKKLGFAHSDETGALRFSIHMLEWVDGCIKVHCDVRYPVGMDVPKLEGDIKKIADGTVYAIAGFHSLPGFDLDINHPVLAKLTEVARQVIGRPEIPPVMAGGTYARKLQPNAAAYGASIPDHIRLFGMEKGGAHSPDEYCIIDDLLVGIKIYVNALIAIDPLV